MRVENIDNLGKIPFLHVKGLQWEPYKKIKISHNRMAFQLHNGFSEVCLCNFMPTLLRFWEGKSCWFFWQNS